MAGLRVVSASSTGNEMLWDVGERTLVVHTFRLALVLALTLLFVVYQVLSGPFIDLVATQALYGGLGLSFFCSTLYLTFFPRLVSRKWASFSLFVVDALVVAVLVSYAGAPISVMAFLLSFNILLCGVGHSRSLSLGLALWSSILTTWVLLTGEPSGLAELGVLLAVNNICYMVVAFLAGGLNDQIEDLMVQLVARRKEVKALSDLNEIIVNNIATGLLTLDRDGVVTFVNPAATLILDEMRLVGRAVHVVFPDLAPKMATLSGESSLVRIEHEYRDSRQQRLTIEILMSALTGSGGEHQGYMLMIQDLTQIKNLEAVLRQREKLAAVGQLAAGIAHEIRNPLASISGSIQLLSSGDFEKSEENQKLMRITLKEVDRLNGLIAEFLEYVRPEARDWKTVDLHGILRDVVEVTGLNPQLRQDLRRVFDLRSTHLVEGNSDKLKQAFLNIVVNALQAMQRVESPELIVQTFDREDRVIVRIKDNGIGIPENQVGRIFEPFHTTKAGGTGLGLAITHKIFESHDARILVESEVNKGTIFIIEFPGRPNPDSETQVMKKLA